MVLVCSFLTAENLEHFLGVFICYGKTHLFYFIHPFTDELLEAGVQFLGFFIYFR